MQLSSGLINPRDGGSYMANAPARASRACCSCADGTLATTTPALDMALLSGSFWADGTASVIPPSLRMQPWQIGVVISKLGKVSPRALHSLRASRSWVHPPSDPRTAKSAAERRGWIHEV